MVSADIICLMLVFQDCRDHSLALGTHQWEWPCLHYASFVSARPSSADGAENRVYFILQISSQTFAAYIISLCSFDFHP